MEDPIIARGLSALDAEQGLREKQRAEETLAEPRAAKPDSAMPGSDRWWAQLDDDWGGQLSGRCRSLSDRLRDIRLGVRPIDRQVPRETSNKRASVCRGSGASVTELERDALAMFEQRLRARLAVAERIVGEWERSGRAIEVERVAW